MEITQRLEFDHRDRKDIYDYIERHGSVREDEVRRALNIDPVAFGHHLAVLRRDGYVRRTENRIEVAYPRGEPEVHRADGMEFTIRPAGQMDLMGLVEAIRSVAEDGRYIEAETVAAIVDHEEVVLRHNELRSRMFFVATVDDEVVGWVHLDLPEAEKLSHTAVLTVGVMEGHRGHGIGTTLLERGVEWARERGFEKLYNSVPSSNEDAIEFLSERGWETEAVREDHYKMGDEYVDEVMMATYLR